MAILILKRYIISMILVQFLCAAESEKNMKMFMSSPDMKRQNLTPIFDDIYLHDRWNGGSGPGSFEENTRSYRSVLQKLFDRGDINTILDVGCGDWQIMRHMSLPNSKRYAGYDVSELVISSNIAAYASECVEFNLYDGEFDSLPTADLCVIKDVLQHLSQERVESFIANMRKYKYVIITNCTFSNDPAHQRNLNRQILDGGWRPLDLTLAPFSLKLRTLLEYEGGGNKTVHLWENLEA